MNQLKDGFATGSTRLAKYNQLMCIEQEPGVDAMLAVLRQEEEIARVVLFAASEVASFITGSVIVADGGYATM